MMWIITRSLQWIDFGKGMMISRKKEEDYMSPILLPNVMALTKDDHEYENYCGQRGLRLHFKHEYEYLFSSFKS